VDRAAHDHDPDERPLLEQARELLRPDALETRPERRVRVQGYLRLEPDEVLDGLEWP
jgi:hypothetical protein